MTSLFSRVTNIRTNAQNSENNKPTLSVNINVSKDPTNNTFNQIMKEWIHSHITDLFPQNSNARKTRIVQLNNPLS